MKAGISWRQSRLPAMAGPHRCKKTHCLGGDKQAKRHGSCNLESESFSRRTTMSRTTLFVAAALALTVTPAFAQVVVTSRPVVTYYAPVAVPAPVVSYETPVYSTRVVYDAPVVVRRPVTTYYAPVSESVTVSSYVVPTTTYYTPVTTYYGGTVV